MSQSDRHELADLVVSLRRHLQRHQRMGVGLLPQAEVKEKVARTTASEKSLANAERRSYRLRNALQATGHQDHIETVRGSGYRFVAWDARVKLGWPTAA